MSSPHPSTSSSPSSGTRSPCDRRAGEGQPVPRETREKIRRQGVYGRERAREGVGGPSQSVDEGHVRYSQPGVLYHQRLVGWSFRSSLRERHRFGSCGRVPAILLLLVHRNRRGTYRSVGRRDNLALRPESSRNKEGRKPNDAQHSLPLPCVTSLPLTMNATREDGVWGKEHQLVAASGQGVRTVTSERFKKRVRRRGTRDTCTFKRRVSGVL